MIAKRIGVDISKQETNVETKSDRRYKKGYKIEGIDTINVGVRIFVITALSLYFLQLVILFFLGK